MHAPIDLDIAGGLTVSCALNGKPRQNATTSDMLFDVPFLLSHLTLTAFTTLLPGDLVLTGSPGGTGPLHDGDVVAIGIEGIGTLTHPVVGG